MQTIKKEFVGLKRYVENSLLYEIVSSFCFLETLIIH